MNAGAEGIIAVYISGIKVLKGVFPSSGVKGIAVGQKGLSSQMLHIIADGFGIIGAYVGKVAGFAEMNLYSGKLVVKINVFDTRSLHKLFQLIRQIAFTGGKVAEINLCFFHNAITSYIY